MMPPFPPATPPHTATMAGWSTTKHEDDSDPNSEEFLGNDNDSAGDQGDVDPDEEDKQLNLVTTSIYMWDGNETKGQTSTRS